MCKALGYFPPIPSHLNILLHHLVTSGATTGIHTAADLNSQSYLFYKYFLRKPKITRHLFFGGFLSHFSSHPSLLDIFLWRHTWHFRLSRISLARHSIFLIHFQPVNSIPEVCCPDKLEGLCFPSDPWCPTFDEVIYQYIITWMLYQIFIYS